MNIEQILNSISEEDLIKIANKIGPYIVNATLQTPRFLGSKSRLNCHKKTKLQNTFFNLNSGNVTIEEGTFFGSNVSVLTGTHNIQFKDSRRKNAPTKGNDIFIGKGVWIASQAVIIGPCKIGDYAVIAAGSIVLPGEYESGCLYAGIPAKLKRRIEFED